jgi:hypothetical protein
VNLNQRHISSQTHPAAISENHVVGLCHLGQALWIVHVEPALRSEHRGVRAVECAIVAVHGPGGVPDERAAGYVVRVAGDGDGLARGRGDAREEVHDGGMDLRCVSTPS